MPPGPVPLNIDVSDCPRIVCNICKGYHFEQVWEVRQVSKILMPPNGGKVNMQLYKCCACGVIIDLENPTLEGEKSHDRQKRLAKQVYLSSTDKGDESV